MKIKKILSVFMAMLTIFSVLSVNAYALNWDGSSAGGSTNAVNGSSTGYVIRSTEDDYCVVGYRFSVVNSAGNLKVNKVIDVYRNSTNGDNAYSTSAKFSTKYNKKQLIANKDAKLSTTSNKTNCYKEKDMGFVSKLPNPSGVKTWQAYETNINKVLTKIGVGTVANMSYGDKVIIEPLFDVCLAGEYQALTVTEIAYCGRSVKGGSSNGGTSNGTSSTWGFIANYTNRIWPNKLYTPDGQGLWTAASKIADGSKETFNNILTKGYGAGIAYAEDKAPVLTIVYDCYGSSVKITDTSKGFTLGEYNRLCSTSSAHKTVAGTANVYYHTLEYDKALGTNGLHDFSTFGLSAPTGYKFKAWHGAKGDFNESTQYKASQLSDDIKNGDTYEWMSATFSPITYSVRFNGNGSTSGSMSNESFTYDVAKALTANAFKREFTVTYNYNGNGTSNSTAKATATFNGWAKTSSGSVAYTNKQSVKNLSSTQGAVVDIYAKWTDGSVTLPTPTRTGYTFGGWYTAASGGSKIGGGGDSYKPTKDITLYARWTPITYTVQYYLDGVEQTSLKQTCTYGTSYKYPSLPTKTGYSVNGWWSGSSSTSKGTQYAASGSFSNLTSTNGGTVKRYAYSTPVTYEVKFNGNGSTSGSMINQKFTYDVAQNLTANAFKREFTVTYDFNGNGAANTSAKATATFNGWAKTSSGTKVYDNKQNVINLASTQDAIVNIYAKWTDGSVTLPTPTRTGYVFDGWYTTTTGTTKIGNGGDKYTPSKNITVYAHWKPITYTVSYYLDGVEQTSLKQTCTYDTSYKYSTLPTKTGYTVSGWWSGSSSTSKGTQYAVGGSFSNLTSTNGGTIKRYAYSTANTYTVQYYLDGVEQTALKQTCTYGTSYKYPSLPTKTGYSVNGWWSGSSYSSKGTQYTAGGSFSNITATNGSTVKRYAYSDSKSYTVSYYLDGVEQTALKQTCSYDSTYKYPTVPTKTGYVITGWWSGSSASSKGTQYAAGGSFKNLTSTDGGSVKRYAYSTPITYEVKFNGNGATSGTMSNQKFTYDVAQNLTANSFKREFTVTYNYNGNGTSNTSAKATATFNGWAKTSTGTKVYDNKQNVINLASTQDAVVNIYAKWTDGSVTLPTPTRTGYIFDGWYTSASGTTKIGNGGDKYTPSKDITVYAHWKPITYTIKFDGNGSTSGATASMTMTYDVAKNLTANGFVRDGYKFVKWNLKADGTSTDYTDKQSVKNLTTVNGKVITMYAQWEEIQALRLEAIEPNADYREGTEVISSFNIINEGGTDCLPDNNVSVVFKVYKNSTVLKTVTLEKVVVPANDKNLLYFKWTVPENLGSATIYISGEIVTNGKSDSLIKNAYSTCKYVVSATPDTQFEYSAPDNFSVPASPANSSTTAKWSEWKYENGAFKKYNYGIGISDELPSLVPAASANASLNNGIWTMKSGYGVEITLANGMKSISGYTMPGSGSYTAPQYSTVMFPEFSFLNTLNNFRTLELVNNQWMFRENGTYGRIHFTPLWYPDGFYSVNVVQRDCWTPAGMISRTINTKDVTISGSAYDDWIIS